MYDVGQVLYLILNKKQQVVPVQVVEQLVRRTLDGEETLHSVKIPTKEMLYKLEELNAEIYTSLDLVRDKLQDNATSVIGAMILRADELAKQSFELYQPTPPEIEVLFEKTSVTKAPKARKSKKRHNSKKEKTEGMQVTLEDGTVANVSIADLPLP